MSFAGESHASTYAVYIPLDDPIYDELSTLDGLGYLQTYLDEIKPISRVEAARLCLEAEDLLENSGHNDRSAEKLIEELRRELPEEVNWLENNADDDATCRARRGSVHLLSRGDALLGGHH